MPTHVAHRVAALMASAGMNQKHLARVAGLNETYVRDLLKGRSKNPKHQHLAKLAEALDTTVDQLMAAEGRPMSGIQPEGLIRDDAHGLGLATTSITEVDVYAGMGGGGTPNAERILGEWQMPTEWLRQEVRGDLANIMIITLEGDSMAETLSPGDKVIVDLNRKLPSPPGIFVVWDGLAMVAKRLEYLDHSIPPSVRIISDNTRYAPYELTVEEINVIGRIMGRWQRLS